jgi:hypothetical protein
MAAFKQCEFFLVRYVPDVVRGEPVNIGLVLLEDGGADFTGVRFTRDWRRVRCADPDVEVEFLESYEDEFRRLLESRAPEIINYRGPMSRREWLLGQMQQSFSGALELAPMGAVFTESPRAALGELAQRYVEPNQRGTRAQAGRRAIFNAMRDAFEQAGVWQFMLKNIEVAQYTRQGDPLKIDCGYKAPRTSPKGDFALNGAGANGVIHLFHAVSLGTDVNSAKLLAFSYSDLRDGLEQKEHAMSDLTAITDDGLDLNDEGVAFALATLQDSNIAVAQVSQMPAIAERARLELKI